MSAATEPEADAGLRDIIAATGEKIFARFGAVQNLAARSRAEQGVWDEPAWAEIAAAGLPHAMLGEALGGIEVAPALMIIGLAAAQGLAAPLAETMAANWLLAEAGLEPATSAASFADTELNLLHETGSWQAHGLLPRLPWGRACDIVAIARSASGAAHLVRIEPGQFSVTKGQNIAAEPRDDCEVRSTIAADRISTASAKYSVSRMRRLGAALRAVQMAGAMNGVLAMTVAYTRNRQQFGRSLAAFQAIQQLVAGIATQTAAAGVAAGLVAEALPEDLDFSKIAVAKIRAGEAAGAAAAAAHQIHGAIGFSREHPLNLLTRRLWAWRDEFGGEADWSIQLGRELTTSNSAPLWSRLTAL